MACVLPLWGQAPNVEASLPVIAAEDAQLFLDGEEAEVVEEAAEASVPKLPQPPVSPVRPPVVIDPAKTGSAPTVLPELTPRELSPAELAWLDDRKPEPSPDTMDPPEGMEMIEQYLQPLYAGLSKRTEKGDWVTCHFKQPLVPREQTQVAVLGYHDFSNSKKCTSMRMKTAEFCRQMQFLHDSDICVISMQDFLEWRRGTRCLPARCVLITIDDGWEAVYTDAYPVLKAYGYPFTLFLYVRYISGQGASMSPAQIKEMMLHGATIGSHSWNHYYPSDWKKKAKKPLEYAKMVKKELQDSRARLMELFGNCSTYCYPGGYHTPIMRAGLNPAGYKAAFTVIDKKVKCDVNTFQINRYMVFGTDTSIFRRAVTFDASADAVIAAINAAEIPARATVPTAFTGVEAPLTQKEKTAAEKAAAAAAKAAKKQPAPAKPEPAPAAAESEAPLPEPPELTENPG